MLVKGQLPLPCFPLGGSGEDFLKWESKKVRACCGVFDLKLPVGGCLVCVCVGVCACARVCMHVSTTFWKPDR